METVNPKNNEVNSKKGLQTPTKTTFDRSRQSHQMMNY